MIILYGDSYYWRGFHIHNVVHPEDKRGWCKIEHMEGLFKNIESARQAIDKVIKITNAKHVKDLCS